MEAQLLADARVGVLCSGGVDSSLMHSLAAETHTDLSIFHADEVGPSSERDAAERMAKHLGLDLIIAETYDDDFIELLPKLTRHHSSPFHLNPHSVPFYKVSSVIRDNGVKAVLSGEGADELFLGYAWLVPGRTRRRRSRPSFNPSRASLGSADVALGMLEKFHTELDHQKNAKVASKPTIDSLDLLQANLRGLLHRNDTMGMAASIESRFPFLDEKLVGYSLNLPERFKVRRGANLSNRQHPFAIDKWAIRRLAERRLPNDLARRRKVPFATTAYSRIEMSPAFLQGGFVADSMELSVPEVSFLVETADRRLLSRLLHLETWGRTMVRGETDDGVASQLKRSVSIRPH